MSVPIDIMDGCGLWNKVHCECLLWKTKVLVIHFVGEGI